MKPSEIGGKSNTDDSDEEGSSEDENSDEQESEDEENEDEEQEEAQRTPSVEKDSVVVCGVCVNQRNVVAAGDFMQCDKYGSSKSQ